MSLKRNRYLFKDTNILELEWLFFIDKKIIDSWNKNRDKEGIDQNK